MFRKILVLLPLLLAACASREVSIPFIPGFGPHKMDIQQGNVFTKDMLAKLRPGMTRSQVRFVLGTPLLVDPFRTDRWDYVYTLNRKGDDVEQRQLRIYFKDDKLVRYEGDLAVGAELASIPAAKPESDAAQPESAAAQPESAAAKPESAVAVPENPVAAPVATPITPARAPEAAVEIKPQLRLVPTEGNPAKPEDRAPEPSPAVAAQPAAQPKPLEAPPLPRLQLPQEPVDKPAVAPNTPDAPNQ